MSAFDAADTVWFFNIGALMNKVSVRLRGIETLESRPGVLRGFTLGFRGSGGMATALHGGADDEMHGVVHLITRANLDIMQTTELTYDSVACEAATTTAAGATERVACCVFVMQPEKHVKLHVVKM